MNETKIKTNSFKAWLLAARPKTLTGAAVPVMIGLAAAWKDLDGNTFDFIPAVLCMLFAFLMQIEANFVNDYFDWKKGNDNESSRLGPLRACSQGWVTPRAMVIAMIITMAVACFVGLPLVLYGGWEMILVGISCVVFCVLYTTLFSYHGLGDVLVLVFFGIVPVCLTYYLQTGTFTCSVFILSVACGLAVDNLLIVNNYRDIDNDRRDGKITLIVRIGRDKGAMLYLLLGTVATFTTMAICHFSLVTIIMVLYLFLHRKAFLTLRTLQGRELNRVLGDTARNIFIYGILTSLILIIA